MYIRTHTCILKQTHVYYCDGHAFPRALQPMRYASSDTPSDAWIASDLELAARVDRVPLYTIDVFFLL